MHDNGTLDQLDRYIQLANQAEAASKAQAAAHLDAFRKLRAIDPRLTDEAVATFGTDHIAAAYFATQHKTFEGPNVYSALATGERQHVLEVLAAIRHGIYL